MAHDLQLAGRVRKALAEECMIELKQMFRVQVLKGEPEDLSPLGQRRTDVSD